MPTRSVYSLVSSHDGSLYGATNTIKRQTVRSDSNLSAMLIHFCYIPAQIIQSGQSKLLPKIRQRPGHLVDPVDLSLSQQ